MWEVFTRDYDLLARFEGPPNACHEWFGIQAATPHVDPNNPESIHWQMAPRRVEQDGQFPQIEDLTNDELAVYTSAMAAFLREHDRGISFYNVGRDRNTTSAMSWPQYHAHFETGLEPSAYIPLANRPTSFEVSYKQAVRMHPAMAQAYFTKVLSADHEIRWSDAVLDVREADSVANDLLCPHYGESPTGGSFMLIRPDAHPLDIARLQMRANVLMIATHGQYSSMVRDSDGPVEEPDKYPASPIYTGVFANTGQGYIAYGIFVNTQYQGCRAGGSEIMGLFPDRRFDDNVDLADLYMRNAESARSTSLQSAASAPAFAMAAGGA